MATNEEHFEALMREMDRLKERNALAWELAEVRAERDALRDALRKRVEDGLTVSETPRSQQIEALTAERDALRAEVERLREVVDDAQLVWETVPATFDPEASQVKIHAVALNGLRDSLAALRRTRP